MRFRSFAAFTALLFAAAPLLAEPPKPTVVVQTKPVARILGDFREMIRQFAGPAEADKAIKSFENGIKEMLGEQGFEGLDTNRPIGAYVILREAVQETTGVLVVPVTGEKEFVGLLERMKMKAVPVKDKNGVYTLELRGGAAAAILPKGAALQFAGPWAYVTLNGEAADPKDLLGPGDLFDNADQSLVTAKLYPDRFPDKLLKSLLDQLDNTANSIKGFVGGGAPPHIGRMATTFFEQGPKLVRRYAETGQKEAAELTLRLGWDAAAGAGTAELVVTPKAGTSLAKDIAAHAAFANRFAGLVTKDVAVGALVKAPLFAPEVRAIVASALEAGQEELKGEHAFPKQFHPLVDEVAKSLIGSVKKGQFDAAIALNGPDKNGKFTLVGGLSLDNAKAVEKAAREVVKGQNFAKLVELDVAKIGDVNIHKVALLSVFPERERADIGKVFGTDAPGYAAFANDAVFFALGADALEQIKTAIGAKPGPAPFLEVVGNMKRLHTLIVTTSGERGGADFAKIMGTDDKLANMIRVTAAGGEKLTVKGWLNLRAFPRAVGGASVESVKPIDPPPPIIKR